MQPCPIITSQRESALLKKQQARRSFGGCADGFVSDSVGLHACDEHLT